MINPVSFLGVLLEFYAILAPGVGCPPTLDLFEDIFTEFFEVIVLLLVPTAFTGVGIVEYL